VDGRIRRARKRRLSGDQEASVWFADDGTWLRMEFAKFGGRVTMELRSFVPALPVSLAMVAASF
jgi:hypothetical protein